MLYCLIFMFTTPAWWRVNVKIVLQSLFLLEYRKTEILLTSPYCQLCLGSVWKQKPIFHYTYINEKAFYKFSLEYHSRKHKSANMQSMPIKDRKFPALFSGIQHFERKYKLFFFTLGKNHFSSNFANMDFDLNKYLNFGCLFHTKFPHDLQISNIIYCLVLFSRKWRCQTVECHSEMCHSRER